MTPTEVSGGGGGGECAVTAQYKDKHAEEYHETTKVENKIFSAIPAALEHLGGAWTTIPDSVAYDLG